MANVYQKTNSNSIGLDFRAYIMMKRNEIQEPNSITVTKTDKKEEGTASETFDDYEDITGKDIEMEEGEDESDGGLAMPIRAKRIIKKDRFGNQIYDIVWDKRKKCYVRRKKIKGVDN